MSYTNAEQVRHHLVIPYPVQDQVTDQAVILPGSDYVRFYGGAVNEGTVRVKSVQSTVPVRVRVTFSNGAVALGSAVVVPGSVVGQGGWRPGERPVGNGVVCSVHAVFRRD